jgi:hypothetical protein
MVGTGAVLFSAGLIFLTCDGFAKFQSAHFGFASRVEA